MADFGSLTLHASDELVVGATDKAIPTKAAVTGLSDHSSVDLDFLGIKIGIENEGDEIEYFDGLIKGKNSIRMSFNTDLAKQLYPEALTDYADLFEFIPELKKEWKWIEIDRTKFNIDIHGANNVVLVTVDVASEYNSDNGTLAISLNMKKGFKE